jgi:hypothetical protein
MQITKQFTKGQTVRCIYGKTLTVMRQIGTTVWVYELPSTVHASKIFPVREAA